MHWSRTIDIVSAHAEGEVGRVVVGGVLDVPGRTMGEKLRHLEGDDSLLRLALFEPRGAAQMSVNILLPPVTPEADAAFIPLQPDGPHAMSGSNAMCVVTVLLETGTLPMREPETTVVLDTAAGPVRARAACSGGRCERVALEFFPSFAAGLDHPVEVDGAGTVRADIAFGGCWFALVDAAPLGFRIEPGEARALVDLGTRIARAARNQVEVSHPLLPGFTRVEYVMFHRREGAAVRTGNVIHPGRMDRSPCGTGTAALLAARHARGELGAGETLETRSIIDSAFEATITGLTTAGPHSAVVPRISGRAWVFGRTTLGVDPADPFSAGYTLSDTWGEGVA